MIQALSGGLEAGAAVQRNLGLYGITLQRVPVQRVRYIQSLHVIDRRLLQANHEAAFQLVVV